MKLYQAIENEISIDDISALHEAVGNICYTCKDFSNGEFDEAVAYFSSKVPGFMDNHLVGNLISSEKTNYSEDDFADAIFMLKKNFCKERIEDVKKIGKAVYGNSSHSISSNVSKQKLIINLIQKVANKIKDLLQKAIVTFKQALAKNSQFIKKYNESLIKNSDAVNNIEVEWIDIDELFSINNQFQVIAKPSYEDKINDAVQKSDVQEYLSYLKGYKPKKITIKISDSRIGGIKNLLNMFDKLRFGNTGCWNVDEWRKKMNRASNVIADKKSNASDSEIKDSLLCQCYYLYARAMVNAQSSLLVSCKNALTKAIGVTYNIKESTINAAMQTHQNEALTILNNIVIEVELPSMINEFNYFIKPLFNNTIITEDDNMAIKYLDINQESNLIPVTEGNFIETVKSKIISIIEKIEQFIDKILFKLREEGLVIKEYREALLKHASEVNDIEMDTLKLDQDLVTILAQGCDIKFDNIDAMNKAIESLKKYDADYISSNTEKSTIGEYGGIEEVIKFSNVNSKAYLEAKAKLRNTKREIKGQRKEISKEAYSTAMQLCNLYGSTVSRIGLTQYRNFHAAITKATNKAKTLKEFATCGICDEFNAFMESAFGESVKTDYKTIDISDGDGVDITDTIKGDPENWQGIIPDDTIGDITAEFDSFLEATFGTTAPLIEGSYEDKKISQMSHKNYSNDEDIAELYDSIGDLETAIKATKFLLKAYKAGKAKQSDSKFMISMYKTKYTYEQLQEKLSKLQKRYSEAKAAYEKAGGDTAYYTQQAAKIIIRTKA